ncbi:MAG: alpha-galactosidase [Lachnospiraceae bacterium]|nr:alpha-galactosidase [Lachnospiraceae bacterium]
MEWQLLNEYVLGDMVARYYLEPESGKVGFYLLPEAFRNRAFAKKGVQMEALVQLKLTGDIFGGSYGVGMTMRNSQTIRELRYCPETGGAQCCEENDGEIVIHTPLQAQVPASGALSGHSYRVIHRLRWRKGTPYVKIFCTFENGPEKAVILEMFESFSLGGLSPYVEGSGSQKLYLHRIRSAWSQEGVHEVLPAEDLLLEPAWPPSPHSVRCERFGQVGSLPVNRFFPFAAVEDRENKIFWGALVAHPASWQMEFYRKDDGLSLSGGMADRDFGQWMKTIAPGESFTTPEAIVTVAVTDSFDEATGRLTSEELESFYQGPACERELPIVFNEYCTTWGCPSHENITGILNQIKDKGFSYFVIDCGWYKEDGVPWDISMGDYNVSKSLFPEGLEKTVDAIREAGMKPGIWFEIENVGNASRAYQMEEHLLHRDGAVLTTDARRFWDMCDPWVQEYLSEKVIGTLKAYGFEYMKIDCNETIGPGCDGAESLGEGLRRNQEASKAFLEKVKQEIPGIILENCASGGHRLEPGWMDQMSMASFSDAHECVEIPIIAAHLHRVIHPVKSQIWAVIRTDDSLKRIAWSMINTFLGRMCLSGDVTELSRAQWQVIDNGIAFYKKLVPVIRSGQSYLYGPHQRSFRHPEGWQALVRVGGTEREFVDLSTKGSADTETAGKKTPVCGGSLPDGNGQRDGARSAYVVLHTFEGELPEQIRFRLPDGCPQQIREVYSDTQVSVAAGENDPENVPEMEISKGEFIWRPKENLKAVAVRLS